MVLGVEVVEGEVEGREYSGFEFGFGHEVVLCVIELEVYYLVDVGGVGVAEIVEVVEELCIVFEFCVFGLGWYKMDVVPSFILVAVLEDAYTSLTWVVTSGAYRCEMISLGGSFSNIGCRK